MADIDNSGPKAGVPGITQQLQDSGSDKRTKDGRRNAKEDTLVSVKDLLESSDNSQRTFTDDISTIKGFAKDQLEALNNLVSALPDKDAQSDAAFKAEGNASQQISLLTNMANSLAKLEMAVVDEDKDGGVKGIKGMSGGFGGGPLLSKLGIVLAGVGVAAAGIGFGLNQAAQALKQFEDIDGLKIAQNINDILTIVPSADGEGALLGFLAEGATFTIVMTGLGLGLAAFGVGAGVTALTNFLAPDYAKNIKDNVLTLLSISDAAGGNLDMLADGGALTLALIGLGAGLAVFGAGSAVGGMSDAMTNFVNPQWAQNIKDNVLILLSIPEAQGGNLELLKDGGALTLALTGLGIGLAIFGVGSTVAGLGGALTDFVDPLWAQGIKDNVLILLSIGEAAGGNVEMLKDGGAFFLAMTGLGAGLAVFGLGQTFIGIGNFFAGDGMAQKTKDDVDTLLSIVDKDPNILQKSRSFKLAMGNVADAMALYGSGTLKKAGADFLGGIAKMFTFGGGEPSPVDVAIRIGNNEAKINKGAIGMKTLARSLETFSRVDLDSADLSNYDELMEDLIAFTSQLSVLQGTGEFAGVTIEEPMLDTLNEFSDTLNNLADALNNVTTASNNFGLPDITLGPELYQMSEANRAAPQVTNIINNVDNSSAATSTTVVQAELEANVTDGATQTQ